MRGEHKQGDNTIWTEDGRIECAWTKDGMRAFFVNEGEKDMNVIDFFKLMDEKVGDDRFRCSRCGDDRIGKPSGYPFFAGVSCPDCWEIHQDKVAEQKRTGDYCLMCKKPRLECYC